MCVCVLCVVCVMRVCVLWHPPTAEPELCTSQRVRFVIRIRVIVDELMPAAFEAHIAAGLNSVMQHVGVSGSVRRRAFWKKPAATSQSPEHAAKSLLSTRTAFTMTTTPPSSITKGAPYVVNCGPEKGRFGLSQRRTAMSLQSEQLRRVILSLEACVFSSLSSWRTAQHLTTKSSLPFRGAMLWRVSRTRSATGRQRRRERLPRQRRAHEALFDDNC